MGSDCARKYHSRSRMAATALLRFSCENANVSYSVYLGEDRNSREVVPGGIDFDGGLNVRRG